MGDVMKQDPLYYTGIGYGFYGIGQGLLLTFPRGAGIVATYPSFVTGQTRVRPSFLTAAIDAGMRIEPRTQAPLLSSGEFGFSDRIVGRYPIDNFGNSATIAERNRLVQN